jgi:hypothetical protein
MIKKPKEDDEGEAFAVLTYAGPENKKINLKAISCANSEIEVKHKDEI